MENKFCQSCGMPITSEEQFGRNADGSKNEEYCSYCYRDGAFTENCTILDDGTSKRKEMKNLVKTLKKVNPNVDNNIFKSMDNVNLNCILGTKKDGTYKSFLEDYDDRKQ